MVQKKPVFGLALASMTGVWQLWAHQERENRKPKMRLGMDATGAVRRTFFGGSADEAISDVLQTGDGM
jgi:hypothetical protein